MDCNQHNGQGWSLVLEGGAMRGMFTCGVIDVMMEHDLWPEALIGVSAGAAFGCNYKSRQRGRGLRYNQRFAGDPRFCSISSLVRTGDLFNAQFAYHDVPNLYDVFDGEAFGANPMRFFAVCTDVESGKAVYKELSQADDEAYDWIRASASMPLASRPVRLGTQLLLDGGVADSIPLEHFERMGYRRNIVVLTQPEGYRKKSTKLMPLMKLALRHHPNLVQAMKDRPTMYNAELDYVAQAEGQRRCLVIRPKEKLPIGHISHNPAQMQLVYDIGRQTAMQRMEEILRFVSTD